MHYAAELGYVNPITYVDNGASGLSFDRPAFSDMNADIAAGKIDAVIVHSISRIGRNMIETLSWLAKMKRKDIALKVWDGSLESQARMHTRYGGEGCLILGKKITTRAKDPCG